MPVAARKPGRPRVRPQTEAFRFYVDAQDAARIRTFVKERALNQSEFMRRLVLHHIASQGG